MDGFKQDVTLLLVWHEFVKENNYVQLHYWTAAAGQSALLSYVTTIWPPCCTTSLKWVDTQGVKNIVFAGISSTIWSELLLANIFCPLVESKDKSVRHIKILNKKKKERNWDRGCKWWLELPLCAVNVHHFLVFILAFLFFDYEYD